MTESYTRSLTYSTGDLDIVNQIADSLRPHAEVFYWDKDKEPGKVAWETIFSWIDDADLILAVTTDQTVKRSISVGQEIGRAVTKGKLVVPLVSADVPVSELGCLSGATYQPISRENIGEIVPVVAGKLKRSSKKGRKVIALCLKCLELLD